MSRRLSSSEQALLVGRDWALAAAEADVLKVAADGVPDDVRAELVARGVADDAEETWRAFQRGCRAVVVVRLAAARGASLN